MYFQKENINTHGMSIDFYNLVSMIKNKSLGLSNKIDFCKLAFINITNWEKNDLNQVIRLNFLT